MFILRQIKKVITKREDVTKQVSVKYPEENSVSGELGSLLFLLGGMEKRDGFWLWALI